jgi:hypothetical protein
MDSRDLAAFRQFLDEASQRVGQTGERIERSQATLARAYQRLARERPPRPKS